MQVAVVGLGGIATKAYLPLLADWPGVELHLYSRRRQTVDRIREQYRLSSGTSDWAELLRLRPQAAFVLTPSETHFELTQGLLDAGVDVFVEKPATLHSEETRQLALRAEKGGRVLMVGFNRRFAPLHVRARELWQGHPTGLCVFSKHRDSAVHPDLSSNYVDDTIHIIDMLRFFCGEARAVRTTGEIREGRLVGAVSLAVLEGGGSALIVTSLEAGGWGETYALHGAKASLEIEAFSRLRLLSQGEERVQREGAGSWRSTLERRGFPQQIAHFFECVASRREPATSAWEAYRTQQLLEALVAAERPA